MKPSYRRWGVPAAFALALMLLAMPVQRVAACSCAMTTLPEAVREADVAFVGRLLERVPGGDNFGFPPEDEWRWSVESSRDPDLEPDVAVIAALADGANCGVLFTPGERWLVLAHVGDGRLHTNGCVPNRRMDGPDPEADALVSGFLPVRGGPADAAPLDLPAPVLVIGLAIGLVALVGVLAFRRAPVS